MTSGFFNLIRKIYVERKPLKFWNLKISYFILLITQQYWLFLVSRVINWVTWGNISILQAILTDISPTPEEKKKNFGLLWAIFGMWFIIWPVIGSLLLKFSSIDWIFWFGWVFAIIEVLLLIFHFKNTNHPQPEKPMSFNSFGIIYKFLKHPTMRDYVISFSLIWIGWFIINVGQSLYMNNLFWTTWEQYWYILWTLWLLNWVNMWVLVPKFWTKNFSNKFLIVMWHIALIVWYLATGMINQLIPFLLTFFVTIFLSGTNMPVYNTEIMSKANRDEIGEVSGMMWWLQSLMMFVWPLIGWILLASKLNIFYGAAAFIACSMAVMVRVIIKEKSIDSKD